MTAETSISRTDDENANATLQFRSTIDILTVLSVVAVTTVVGAALLSSTPFPSQPNSFWWAVVAGILLYAALWWSTSYDFDATELRVRSCGITWRVPFSDIRELRDGIGLMKGGALSIRRLEIVYGASLSVAVSPGDSETFLSVLRSRRRTA